MAPDYYVYVHRRKSDGAVFYVGKGKGLRAWDKNKDNRSQYWHKIVRKHGLIVEIVESGYAEWFAHEREIQLIEKYGRSNLCNHTDGGEGCSNPSAEARKQMGAANRGRKRSSEHIAKIVMAHKGVPRTDAVKQKISAGHKGKPKPSMQGEKHPLARSVICAQTGIVYPTIQMAVDWLHSIGRSNANSAGISGCARGYKKTAYGFAWKYNLSNMEQSRC